jgi:hypothetical protein
MPDYLQLGAYTNLKFGATVTKTAVAIPNNTTSSLFTVSTGNVLVTALYGVTTTSTTVAAFTLGLGVAPTTGTANTTSIATAVGFGTKETGVWVTPQVSSGEGGALVTGANGGTTLFKSAEFTVPPGTITATTSANPGATSKMTWYLAYVPLDTGAYVS